MAPRKFILILLLVLPLFLFMAEDEEHQTSGSGEFLGKVVNFVLLFGGLTLLLRKPLRKFLDSRGKEIAQKLKQTRTIREEAEADLTKVQGRLDELSQEIQEMNQEAEGEGKGQKDQILVEARAEAERLKSLAQQEIETLSQQGGRELRAYAAELATLRAEERINDRITPKDQTQLIDESIERLERLHEESGSG
jgi:F-type H+-transporting ATPase subunit b